MRSDAPAGRVPKIQARAAIGLVLGLAFLFFLRDLVFTAFLGLVLATLFSFPVNFFHRVLPRGFAVLLTLALVLAGAGFFFYSLVEPMSRQAALVEEKLPEAVRNARSWFHRQQAGIHKLAPEASPPPTAPKSAATPDSKTWWSSLWSGAKTALTSAVELASFLVLVLVLSLFFVHEPDLYRRELRSLVPPAREADFDELWKRMGVGLRHWVGGILVAMTIMGTFCALGLWAAGIQNWLLLGILTFFGTFIPYAGAIASAIPGLLMAAAQSGETFLAACAVYLGVHLVEGYIVQPLIMKRAVTLPPASLLLWQFAMALIGGPLGVIVATPLFVCLKIALDYLYVERSLGKRPYPDMPGVTPKQAPQREKHRKAA